MKKEWHLCHLCDARFTTWGQRRIHFTTRHDHTWTGRSLLEVIMLDLNEQDAFWDDAPITLDDEP